MVNIKRIEQIIFKIHIWISIKNKEFKWRLLLFIRANKISIWHWILININIARSITTMIFILYIMFGYFIDDMLIDIFIIEFILCNLNILFSRCCNRISNINEGRLLLICLLIVCGFDPCLSCWTRSFSTLECSSLISYHFSRNGTSLPHCSYYCLLKTMNLHNQRVTSIRADQITTMSQQRIIELIRVRLDNFFMA